MLLTETGKELTTKRSYVDNKLFSTEDPYGRKQYFAYDATDGRLIRTVHVFRWAQVAMIAVDIKEAVNHTARNYATCHQATTSIQSGQLYFRKKNCPERSTRHQKSSRLTKNVHVYRPMHFIEASAAEYTELDRGAPVQTERLSQFRGPGYK